MTKKPFLSNLKKIKVPNIFRESILIILSILLALVLNEWRANHNLETEKEKILGGIVLELENNLESLNHVMPYHKDITQSLNKVLSDPNVLDTLGDRLGIDLFFHYAEQGFKEPRIQANAWQTALLSGTMSRFDIETISRLSALYELQEEGVEIGWKKTVESFYDTESFEPSKNYTTLKKFYMTLKILYQMEQYLIEKHEETLEYLKNKK